MARRAGALERACKPRGEAPFPALQQAVDAVFDARIGDISGRGKLAADMREIWLMQPRFERRSGNTPRALVEQPRYRAGYDFLRLRADAGEVEQRTGRVVGRLRPRRRRRARGAAQGRARAAAAAAPRGGSATRCARGAVHPLAEDEPADEAGATQAPPPAPQARLARRGSDAGPAGAAPAQPD